MRLTRVRAIAMGAAIAVALTTIAAASAAGAVPSARDAAGSRTIVHPGVSRVIVHPGLSRVGHAPGDQIPLTDSQCEAIDQVRCYVPDQVEAAYNLPALYNRGITGKGRTIVIVDAYGSPTISDDVMQFDDYLGLGAPPLRIVKVGRVPAFDPSNPDMVGWASETSLDVEYAHAGAPGAKIVLVEAASEDIGGLTQAVEYVVTHRLGDVISLSWGAPEQAVGTGAINALNHVFSDAARAHITVVASSGDQGVSGTDNNGNYYIRPVASWPATNPLVTAVGGTQLNLDASGKRAGPDRVWNDTNDKAAQNLFFGNDGPNPLASGGGKSVSYARPAYQNSVRGITGAHRGIPDISMSASCSVAVNVYMTFYGVQGGWLAFCGTSESAPMFAAVVALAAQLAGHSLGPVNPAIYKLSAEHAPGIWPVPYGNNTVSFAGRTVRGYSARNGYSLAAGVGTVNGQYFVPELARLG